MQPWHYLLFGGVMAGAALAGAVLHGVGKMIGPPRCDHRDDPAAWGLRCEDVTLRTPDGLRLEAWLARGEGRSAVIVLHGHGGNRYTSIAYASCLFPRFTVILPDFRGHGDSEGRHTSIGYHERQDVIAAAEYLHGQGYDRIGVLGVSMGAATAILAAAESPLIDAVAADSGFAMLRLAVAEGARQMGYPKPLVRLLAHLACRASAWRLRHPMDAVDPLHQVGRIAPRPLLLIHGEADGLIPVDSAHRLYAAAGEPKELWILPEVGHARAIEQDADLYRQRVADFFERTLGGDRAEPAGLGSGLLDGRPLGVGQPAAQAGAGQVDQVAQDQPAHVHRSEDLRPEARGEVNLPPGLDAGGDQDEDDRDRQAVHHADPAA